MATATHSPNSAVPPILDGEFAHESSSLVHQPMAFEALQPIMDIETAKQRLEQFQKFVEFYLVPDEDYGKIPGIKKASLWKSGADKLCEIYGLEETYTELRITEDWDKGLFDYTIQCTLVRNGIVRGMGVGSCSSYESKYRWRDGQRKCPQCNKDTAIIKGKEEYGGGWLCFARKGGCGAKFADNDPQIIDQQVGKILNPDMADVKNTIIKMAKKRAKVDATLAATRSSGIFTQDVEDSGTAVPPEDHTAAEHATPQRPPAQPAPSAASAQASGAGECISERDRKSIYQLMGRNGRSHDQLVAYLRANHSIDAPSKITTRMFPDVCLWAKGVQ